MSLRPLELIDADRGRWLLPAPVPRLSTTDTPGPVDALTTLDNGPSGPLAVAAAGVGVAA